MKDALFNELLESVEQMDEITKGEREPSRENFVAATRVKRIRQAVNLSQPKFAKLIGVEVSTLRNWEQGRREPTGPARVLIKAIEKDPENVLKACSSV
ncbi:Putative transcriptional regulator [Idiomarina sp. A28L]|uniref:NadS family protein n=1 Tax=Idiomarina sp. A28L TaxID=1036674 RepID=UPI0002138CD4|nr:NadS family protein [Idiomarina sp. A28L]EGN74636.1 Putative transcriptional regulator [Idiomarina sp. A28L]